MRLPHAIPRRSAHLLVAWALSASISLGPARRASARVEGIPLYAPGDKIKLPEEGFEVQLPRLEALRDRTIPLLRAALDKSDWEAAATQVGPDAVASQLRVLGDTASILGDEAYTALSLKAKYAASVRKLQAALVSAKQDDALREVDALDATISDYIALVPAKVVELVREREGVPVQKAGAAVPTAPPAPAEAPTTGIGGLLMTPSNGDKLCGRDSRC